MFYSQFGQDKYFSELFKDNYKGVCIEIGAYDGIVGSNTLHFENKGWECLCIEANYDAYLKCKKLRKNTLNYCVSNENNDNSIFTIFNLKDKNQSAISSLKPDLRLIQSHTDYIIDSVEQNVKSRTLTTILNNINFSRDIDFISIDTENTEIDVLNGIDFEYYNIKYLLIENNYNEDICKNYLLDKGYKKINRIAVDDIYMKDDYEFNRIKISRYFKIISAHYHQINKCDKFNSNVTDIVNDHFKEYIKDNSNNLLNITNVTFEDRYPGHVKKLFLNYETITGERCLIINELETLNWEDLLYSLRKEYLFYINPYNNNQSLGQTINHYISSNIKNDKDFTLNYLDKNYNKLYENFSLFFNLIFEYNIKYNKYFDKYKLLTNKDDSSSYEYLLDIKNTTKEIFNYELKINRVINYFDNLVGNKIKLNNTLSQNSDKNIYLHINDYNDIFDKISEINYLCMEYNIVYLNIKYQDTIKKIFKNPNILFENEEKLNKMNTIILKNYFIESEILNLYEFKPITYLCSGRLGDFLNSLSIINENYHNTGRKGILYIADENEGDRFRFGPEYAYKELYEIIMNQNYIKHFKVFNQELVDINLNKWRHFIVVPTTEYDSFYNWKNIFGNYFSINWGKHKWLNNIYYDETWSNKIIINMTEYRSARNIDRVKSIVEENKNNIYFITFDNEEYEYFINRFELNKDYVKIYLLKSLDELCVIINSCKYPYLGVSSFAVIANALFKKHTIFSSDDNFGNFTNNMVNILPHMLEFI